jgi:hypothetical protein
MADPRELISAFHELNSSEAEGGRDVRISRFTPALVGMIGANHMFDALLSELDAALRAGMISEELKVRARNLARTFIPQVAALNSIVDLPVQAVSAEELRSIRCDSPQGRKEGVTIILAALLKILESASALR